MKRANRFMKDLLFPERKNVPFVDAYRYQTYDVFRGFTSFSDARKII